MLHQPKEPFPVVFRYSICKHILLKINFLGCLTKCILPVGYTGGSGNVIYTAYSFTMKTFEQDLKYVEWFVIESQSKHLS